MPLPIKDVVLGELLSNLRSISISKKWTESNPDIQEYVKHMSTSVRAYHTWELTKNMLDELQRIPPCAIEGALRLKAAVLFLNVIYVPGQNDNRMKSIEFASRFYSGNTLAHIVDMIDATHHKTPFQKYGDDCDVLCDLDLMILGESPDKFKAWYRAIAREFDGVLSVSEFKKRIREFCHQMLKQSDNGGLFRTNHFKHREQQAFENLSWLLEKVSG